MPAAVIRSPQLVLIAIIRIGLIWLPLNLLVVHYYYLAVFRIGSLSMAPTLLGQGPQGDLILVDKWVYRYRNPRRWEVVVFKAPFNTRQFVVKRLIGLPGERVQLLNGNVYINGRIARKPPGLTRSLLQPVFTAKQALHFADYWEPGPGHWHTQAHCLLAQQPAWLRYMHTLSIRHPIGRISLVGEVALRVVFSLQAQGWLEVRLRQIPGSSCVVHLTSTARNSYSSLQRHNSLQRWRLPGKLEREKAHHLVLSNIDQQLQLQLDGRLWLQAPYQIPVRQLAPLEELEIVLGGAHCKLYWQQLRLWRDNYYTNNSLTLFSDRTACLYVPAGHYFVLGDNSAHSQDSRAWRIFRLITRQGRSFEGRQSRLNDPGPYHGDYLFHDRRGLRLRLACEQVRCYQRDWPAPFVPRRCLLGRVLLICWPPLRLRRLP